MCERRVAVVAHRRPDAAVQHASHLLAVHLEIHLVRRVPRGRHRDADLVEAPGHHRPVPVFRRELTEHRGRLVIGRGEHQQRHRAPPTGLGSRVRQP
ncbi:hypothetical protein RB200_35170 [Streptomyces sp. PmtG]